MAATDRVEFRDVIHVTAPYVDRLDRNGSGRNLLNPIYIYMVMSSSKKLDKVTEYCGSNYYCLGNGWGVGSSKK